MERKAQVVRKTNETNIIMEFNIDGSGKHEIHTSVALLDHFMSQIAVHGSFNLKIKAEGDLEVDAHHLVEDTAIVLGTAFRKALKDKVGINRVGHCYFPMDESLAFVAVDLSSRPYFKMDVQWVNPFLGTRNDNLIAVDLLEHFLYSFAIHAQVTLHVMLLYGKNNHHIAEAVFKALGKALDHATRIDPKRKSSLPSSKGEL